MGSDEDEDGGIGVIETYGFSSGGGTAVELGGTETEGDGGGITDLSAEAFELLFRRFPPFASFSIFSRFLLLPLSLGSCFIRFGSFLFFSLSPFFSFFFPFRFPSFSSVSSLFLSLSLSLSLSSSESDDESLSLEAESEFESE